ncbi:hypothetical protein NO263_16805 [Gluconacetobacter entanii]|uniref:Uncharacterized protein n=1 Tax=Gluconacetobacter entanii TaxID=108528 RepID=A0ABT3K9Y3_9PROT|nr:hypothetical protein [Gluconacetobacter entanii]MCW4592247.1 hypothetical protein [Gluconacetobacter entanii]MCW4595744.1 hypothetical protein [Gluconacetobacter entanii]NPC87460.1 hypothetical protein [Gluconacetobacter entanii]
MIFASGFRILGTAFLCPDFTIPVAARIGSFSKYTEFNKQLLFNSRLVMRWQDRVGSIVVADNGGKS